MVIISSSIGISSAYADHGSGGGGGGCSGDCTPPSLGIDNKGYLRVENGVGINYNYFNVETYSQDIPTQILKVNENNNISVKIYENSGPEFLNHAELHFNIYEEILEGITVENSIVSIVWDNSNGEVYAVYGEEHMVKDVSIKKEIQDEFIIINFEFKFTEKMKTSTMMIKTWDDKRNSSKNYFFNAIEVREQTDLQIVNNKITNSKNQTETVEVGEKINIPPWVKHISGWWADNIVADEEFISSIQFLIKEKIITVSDTNQNQNNELQEIPTWIKQNAEWWADNKISDDDFMHGIQHLIKNNIITIPYNL